MTLRTALIIDGDSAGGQKALADLNRSIAQTEQQATSMGRSSAASATQMAASAQTAAVAASRAGASYTALSDTVHGNTIAMRESLVVSRELLTGNLTRLPGSLSILAQQFAISGKGAGDFAKDLLSAYGVIKIAQDEELVASAASAAGTASVIAAEAKRAQSAIVAADAEVLLSEAAVRNAEGSVAETAAQTRLVAAHEAVAAAAAEAAIAEEALTVAAASAGEAAAAAGAEATIGLGPVGIVLGVVAVAAIPAIAAFKAIKAEIDRQKLDDFAQAMHLTAGEAAGLNDNVLKLVENLEKNAGKARDAAEAQEIYARTADGAIEGVKKLTDEIDKQNRTLQDNINLKKSQLGVALLGAESNQVAVTKSLADAQAAVREAQKEENTAIATGNPDSLVVAEDMLDRAKGKVADLQKQLGGLNDAVAAGRKGLTSIDFPLIEQRAKDSVDPIAAINHQFDQLVSNAERAGTYTQAYANHLEQLRKAAIDTAQAQERLNKGTGEFGRQVSFGQAEAIAKGAGLTVTSGQRSDAEQARLFNDPRYNRPGNPVARPVSMGGVGSAHEGINGKWALDIAFAPGLTAQSLKKLYGDQGVTLSAVYKEGGHFHIEGSRSQAATQDNAAARAAAQDQRNEAAYVQEKDSLEQSVIAARKALATSAEQVWGFEVAAAIAAHQKLNDQIAANDNAHKYRDGEAAALRKINDEHEKLAEQLADQRLAEAQSAVQGQRDANAVTVETGLLGAQEALLQSQQGLARTAQERKDLEDKLIDLQFTEQRIQLEAIVAESDRLTALAATTKSQQDIAAATKAQADAAVAQAKLANLPAQQANAHSQNAQTNGSPLEQFANSVPQSAKEIGDALEKDAVQGINDFNDGLAKAIVQGGSLKDVIHNLADEALEDLLKIGLEEAEVALLKAVLGSSFGGGKADGGPVAGGTPYLIGERGPELFIPSSSGTIVPNHRLASSGMRPANDTGGIYVSLSVANDFRGAAPEAVAQLSAQVDQMKRELPGTIVKTVIDARQRFVLR